MDKEKHMGIKINQTGRVFKKVVREECAKKGINGTYSMIIMHLSHSNGLSQNELCKILHLAAPTISLTLRNMESEGLIERSICPDDSRRTIVKLTSKGYECDEVIKSCFELVEERMIKNIKDEDIQIFSKVIDNMMNNLIEEGGM